MDSTKTIPWSMAWQHCASTASYWIGIIAIIIAGLLLFLGVKWLERKLDKDMNWLELLVVAIAIAALLFAVMSAPSTIAANTSWAMYYRHHFIY